MRTWPSCMSLRASASTSTGRDATLSGRSRTASCTCSSAGRSPRPEPEGVAGAPVEVLRQVPLFAELEPNELEQVARLFKKRTFSTGETVTKEGSGGAAFFLIESGQAEVTVRGRPRPPLQAGDH